MIGLGGWKGRNEKMVPRLRMAKSFATTPRARWFSWQTLGRGCADSEHPITRGLPSEFLMVKEELYDRFVI